MLGLGEERASPVIRAIRPWAPRQFLQQLRKVRESFMEEVTFEFCLGGCVGVSQTENGDYRRGSSRCKGVDCEQGWAVR